MVLDSAFSHRKRLAPTSRSHQTGSHLSSGLFFLGALSLTLITSCDSATDNDEFVEATNNLIENGDFEIGLDGWAFEHPVEQMFDNVGGFYGAKVEPGGSLSQIVDVEPGEDYLFRLQMKVFYSPGEETFEEVQGVNVLVDGSQTYPIGPPSRGRHHEVIEVPFTAQTDQVLVSFGEGASLRIDDVYLGKAEDAGSTPIAETRVLSDQDALVLNGDFEMELSFWEQITEDATSDDDNYRGIYGAQVRRGHIQQTVPVVPGEDYSLSVMLKIEVGLGESLSAERGQAAVDVGDEQYFLPAPTVGNEFQKVSVDFNSGDNDEVTISFQAGHQHIDDVVLEGPRPEHFVNPWPVFDWTQWVFSGANPVVDDQMLFDAVDQFVMTSNASGPSATARFTELDRYPIGAQYEIFSADITPGGSVGTETRVLEWRQEGSGSLGAVFVADINGAATRLTDRRNGGQWLELHNGIANDGIFDVIAIVRPEGGEPNGSRSYTGSSREEAGLGLGAVSAGETFSLEAINDHGELTFTVDIGGSKTSFSSSTLQEGSDNSNMTFGSFVIARDAVTLVPAPLPNEDPSIPQRKFAFIDWFAERGITSGAVRFSDAKYERILADDFN